jgi:GNAT superfamily N-acetyltransferase
MDDHRTTIAPAGPAEIGEALALIEALLAELGDEGDEYAQIDCGKLERDLGEASASGRFLALLVRDDSGTAIGVLTLSASFAVYAGGEYGVIDEMYVRPEYRGRGVGARLVEAAVRVAEERRWFRLDVTGPGTGEESGGPSAEGSAVPAGCNATVGGADAIRFYRRLGFEPTGLKLRRLI